MEDGMDHVEVGGLRVAYRRSGRGAPLVLLHGGLADSREWRRQLEGLADDFTVVAWDAPGCGGSADPPASWRLPDYADCLAGFIRTLELGRPHVGGLSWGGGLALEPYGRHPQLPRSLVLASAYAGWAGSLPPEVVRERVDAALHEAELPPEQWVPGWLPGLFTAQAPAEVVSEALVMMSEVRPAGMRPMLQSFAEADLREVLPRTRCRRCCCMEMPTGARPPRWSPAICTPRFPAPGWWCCPGLGINATWRLPTGLMPRSAAFSGQCGAELTNCLPAPLERGSLQG
jgi:pimeloyl-ACP methyl ester carboxylesterase